MLNKVQETTTMTEKPSHHLAHTPPSNDNDVPGALPYPAKLEHCEHRQDMARSTVNTYSFPYLPHIQMKHFIAVLHVWHEKGNNKTTTARGAWLCVCLLGEMLCDTIISAHKVNANPSPIRPHFPKPKGTDSRFLWSMYMLSIPNERASLGTPWIETVLLIGFSMVWKQNF